MSRELNLTSRVLKHIRDHHSLFKKVSLYVKILLIAGGTLLVALASFGIDTEVGFLEVEKWSKSQFVGFVGAFLSFLGAVFVFLTEDNSGAAYDAFEAINDRNTTSKKLEDLYDILQDYEETAKRFQSLYLAYSSARGVLEQAAATSAKTEIDLIEQCLFSTKQDLKLSLGFEMQHTWTICIYKSVHDAKEQQYFLECIAHDRSIMCDLAEARKWKEGVGVGGMALAKNGEVTAPDILSHDAGSLFRLEGNIVRREDLVRYRSMMAVPINIDGDQRPWGVVLVSCDQPNFFGTSEVDHFGLQPEEAVRTLAAITALAIAIFRSNTT